MKRYRMLETAAVASLLILPTAAWGQSENTTAADHRNRFSLGYRLGFDISARFETVRPLSRVLNLVPETGHGINRNYAVGLPYETYVRTDVNNNQYLDPETGEIIYATWNWGVSSLDQINPAEGTVRMSTATEVSESSFETKDSEMTHGLEVIYNRELGPLQRGIWGVEAAFGFDQVGLRDRGAADAQLTRITDWYRFLAPAPDIFDIPPQGQFDAPPSGWPLLTDEPISGRRLTTTETLSQAATGHYEFDADLFGFRIGPYAEFPLGRKWHVSLSGGLALLIVDSRFKYEEAVVVPGYPNPTQFRGAGGDTDVLLGGYVAGRIHYFLSDRWNIFVGGQWQGMSQYGQRVGGKEAQVDVGGRAFFTAGVGFSF